MLTYSRNLTIRMCFQAWGNMLSSSNESLRLEDLLKTQESPDFTVSFWLPARQSLYRNIKNSQAAEADFCFLSATICCETSHSSFINRMKWGCGPSGTQIWSSSLPANQNPPGIPLCVLGNSMASSSPSSSLGSLLTLFPNHRDYLYLWLAKWRKTRRDKALKEWHEKVPLQIFLLTSFHLI